MWLLIIWCVSFFFRDNVEWTQEQEAAAKKKVQEHSQPLPTEKQGLLIQAAKRKSLNNLHAPSVHFF